MGAKTYFLRVDTQGKEKEFFISLLERLGVENLVLGDEQCDFHQENMDGANSFDKYDEIIRDSALKIYSDNEAFLLSVREALYFSLNKMNYNFDKNKMSIQSFDIKVWTESWKESFKPIFIKNDLVVYPPWLNGEDFSCKYKIVLNPGLAFGTGQHETTQLCLESILRSSPKDYFLDVGTGSGILSILASKMGYKKVYAVDIDRSSITTSKDNAKINKVNNIDFQIGSLNNFSASDNFELIVANIHYEPLCAMVEELFRKLKPGGKSVFSGILRSELESFKEKLMAVGFKSLECDFIGDWSAVVSLKP